jgi:hypothetical protein
MLEDAQAPDAERGDSGVLADRAAMGPTEDSGTEQDAASVDSGVMNRVDAARDGRVDPRPDASSVDSGPSADSGTGDGGATAPRGARVVRDGCTGTPGPLAGTTCRTLEITCGGLEPLQVELLIAQPPSSMAARGVILFGSGGAGTGLWSGPDAANGAMDRLRNAGFIVIERRWLNDRNTGWFQSTAGLGVAAAACRHATLSRWIDSTYRSGTMAFCATGNSGGSAELAWSITRQDTADVIDFAVPTSGPLHRADYGCATTPPAAWTTECATLKDRYCASCASRTCTLPNGVRSVIDSSYGMQTTCSGRTTPFDGDRMLADSPAARTARLNLPHTRVAFLIGALDGGPYLPLAAGLYEAMRAAGTNTTFSVLPGVDHELQSFTDGARRIETEMLMNCVRRR